MHICTRATPATNVALTMQSSIIITVRIKGINLTPPPGERISVRKEDVADMFVDHVTYTIGWCCSSAYSYSFVGRISFGLVGILKTWIIHPLHLCRFQSMSKRLS